MPTKDEMSELLGSASTEELNNDDEQDGKQESGKGKKTLSKTGKTKEVDEGEGGEKDQENEEDLNDGSEGDEGGDEDEDDFKEEFEELKRQNENLLARLNEKDRSEKKDEPLEIKIEPLALDDVFPEDKFDDLMDDGKKMRPALIKAIQTAHKRGVEDAMKVLPGIVNSQVQAAVELHIAIKEFWGRNKDLLAGAAEQVAKIKKKAGEITQRVHSAYPDYDYDKLFSRVEKELRKELGVKSKEKQGTRTDGRQGAFVQDTGKGGRVGAPKHNKITEQLNLMMGRKAR